MIRRVDISYKTIIFITAFLLLLWILYHILDVILLFFVSLIFMSALAPMADKLVSWKIPRVLAIIILYLLVILVLTGILTVGFSPLVEQTSNLSLRLVEVVNNLLQTNLVDRSLISQELTNFSKNLIGFLFSIVQNILGFISVAVITFYLLLDRGRLESYVANLFGKRQPQAERLIKRIEGKLGAWLRGQLFLSFLIGVLTYVGLLILGVEFALPLAIIAGILEVVPVIGPIISLVPAILSALAASPLLALLVGGLYLAIQQMESHVIVPQVMKKAVGLNPLVIILAISAGGKLLGIAGALLAVPVTVVIQVVLEEMLKPKTE